MELCVLRIDQKNIGIPMDSVREVLIRPGISPIPLTPSFLVGVTSFRGISLPVIELTPLLDLIVSPLASHSRNRVVVCQQGEDTLGLRVDLLDRKSISDMASSEIPQQNLLEELPLDEDSTLSILNLPKLILKTKELMTPSIDHLS